MNAPTTTNVPVSALKFRASAIESTGTDGQHKATGIAYSGEILNHSYWGQVAFDLSSTTVVTPSPLLVEHDRKARAGIVETAEIGSDIKVGLQLFKVTPAGAEAIELMAAKFPWQMSVYIIPGSIEELRPGTMTQVNGRQFNGPGVIFRNSVVREISLCSLGVDPNTSAVAAKSSDGDENINIETTRFNMPSEQSTQPTQPTQPTPDASKFAELEAQVAKLREENASLLAAQRQGEVTKLFAEIGAEVTDEDVVKFKKMDDATFAFFADQLRKTKRTLPEGLFAEVITGGTTTSDQQAIDRMAKL